MLPGLIDPDRQRMLVTVVSCCVASSVAVVIARWLCYAIQVEPPVLRGSFGSNFAAGAVAERQLIAVPPPRPDGDDYYHSSKRPRAQPSLQILAQSSDDDDEFSEQLSNRAAE